MTALMVIWVFLIVVVLGVSIEEMWKVAAYKLSKKPKKPKEPQSESQQMVFMSEATDVRSKLVGDLQDKVTRRSIEIVKADNRFLVTPDDMRKAYEEIIREEHM